MARKHDLQKQIARATEDYCTLAETTEDEGFEQDKLDNLEKTIDDLKQQVAVVERAERRVSELVAIPGRPTIGGEVMRGTVYPEPRKLYSTMKAFKDRRTANGRIVRAEDAAFATGMWAKATIWSHQSAIDWCAQRGISTKAQSEGVDSAGGFLVPEEMMRSIIDLREQYGVFRQEAQIVPMSRDTVNWPRRSGGVTAYFIGENQAVTESQASWDNVQLTAKKLGILTRFSTELEEDAIISIADWLTNEMAYAFASKEDDCGFNGDGTSTYGGVVGLSQKAIAAAGAGSAFTAATGHFLYGLLNMTDITSTMALLPNYALANAKFYMSQTCFAAAFERLIAASGGNTTDTLNGVIDYRFLGFPIVITQKLSLSALTITGTMMFAFGDLRLAAAMGERRQVSVRRSNERYFDADQVGMMATERVDIVCHDTGSATVAGPIVFCNAP